MQLCKLDLVRVHVRSTGRRYLTGLVKPGFNFQSLPLTYTYGLQPAQQSYCSIYE